MIRRKHIVVLILLVALGGFFAANAATTPKPTDYRTNGCSKWSYDMATSKRFTYDRYEFDFKMHIRGCHKPWSTWKQAPTTCMRYAYHYAWNEKKAGRALRAAVQYHGCRLFEDGSWGWP